jgi:hypothetical protein
MSKSLNCACCGRTFNHNGFPYRPSVISALEYACSIRCKSDMESYYSPKKKSASKARVEEPEVATEDWTESNPLLAGLLFLVLTILGIAGIGLALAGA